jgi:hypothetical protein
MKPYTTIAAHVPSEVAAAARVSARKEGARSVSKYVGALVAKALGEVSVSEQEISAELAVMEGGVKVSRGQLAADIEAKARVQAEGGESVEAAS